MKTVNFDAAGQPLWVAITMGGLYSTTFTLRLLESKGNPSPIKILTEPVIAGKNNNDDARLVFPLVNSFNPGEPLAAYDGRFADATFLIKTLSDDNGYTLTVEVLQGTDAATAVSLGSDDLSDTVGAAGFKEAEIKIQLAKQ